MLGALVALLPLWMAPMAAAQIAGFSPEVKWRVDYAQARREAQQRGLPLVIDFGSKSCRYCVLLDQTTFRDPRVVALMNERFIPLKVDADIEVQLTSALRVASFPTIVLAAADGRILSTQVGYKEAGEFHEILQRTLAALTTPDWMQRDLQMATKWMQTGNYARAITALKSITEDGQDRPIKANAEKMLQDLEQLANQRVGKAKDLEKKGQAFEAIEALTDVTRLFPGLQAAKDAADQANRLAKNPEIRNQQRSKRARELLVQAKDFYKNREWIPCLDRCEVLLGSYGDMAEGQEAATMLGEIKNNPEWVQAAADIMAERLGGLYLTLADALLKKGQPQQAEAYLARVMQNFPGSRQAETAQTRLSQLQGLPVRREKVQSAGVP